MAKRIRKSVMKKRVREVKYQVIDTDYDALQNELSGESDFDADLQEADDNFESSSTPSLTDKELEEYAEWARQSSLKSNAK